MTGHVTRDSFFTDVQGANSVQVTFHDLLLNKDFYELLETGKILEFSSS